MVKRVNRKISGKSSELLKNALLYSFVGLILVLVFLTFLGQVHTPSLAPLSEILKMIKEGKIERIELLGPSVTAVTKDGREFMARKEENTSFVEVLQRASIDPSSLSLTVRDDSLSSGILNFLYAVLPYLLTLGLIFLFMRQARGASDSIFAFGKSKAKIFNKDRPKISFADVAGVDEAKRELSEIVDFLKEPEKFRKLGARTPKGVLLVGPTGVGKTLLGRALAGEANVPFFSMAGSEFMEMLVGVGASRVRDLFEVAKKSSPSIIFIDEVESIGRRRGMSFTGGHDEREQTLNQILVEMDGFEPSTSVVVVAATNRPDLLDPALVRPGRFDRQVRLDLPDIEGRKAILKIHMRGKPVVGNVDLEKLSKRMVGFSGADLENMLNEAAILAARANKTEIDEKDLEEAATRVKLGPEKRRLQGDEEKKMTAYHEAGHALVSALLPHMDPVHRISIVSRGLALGFTMIPPAQDRYNETQTRFVEQITTMLGGRAAEEIVFNECTAGAANDIENASRVARAMVTEYGMSDLGPVAFNYLEEDRLLLSSMGESSTHSEAMAAKIDAEVKRIIDESFSRAKKLLLENREKLDLVVKILLEKETLEGEEFEKLIGKTAKKDSADGEAAHDPLASGINSDSA